MILRKIVVLAAVAASLSAFAGGCQSGGVGDPCTPEDEYQPAFSGFSPSEVNVESRSFQCETRVCLVNHFRGRVSCPLGQDDYLAKLSDEYSIARQANKSATPLVLRTYVSDYITGKADLSGGGKSPTNSLYTDVNTVIGKLCVIPGSSGVSPELVRSTVIPQCSARTGDGNNKAVYCSCRCDGDDKDAQYCKCGSGYTCTPFPELTLGSQVAGGNSRGLTGSYCVLNSDVDPVTKLVKYTADTCGSSDTFEAGIAGGCVSDPPNCNGVKKNNDL